MSAGHVPHSFLVRRTVGAEAVRAFAAGVIETAFATFAVFIAVTVFESGPAVKSILLASPALGLLGSLVAVPLVSRLKLKASHAAAGISLVSAGCFAIAAAFSNNEICFLVGMTLGLGVIGMAIPLQTHYLRLNYPDRNRGRLFSLSIVIRASTALGASWAFGVYLSKYPDRYPVLLWTFVAAALIAALCQFLVPSERLKGSHGKDSFGFIESVRFTTQNRVFVKILIAAMILGLGVLASNALRVDYLVNPDHGLEYDVKTVSLITGIIPSIVRLASTFFWGWIFDHMDFLRMRIILNVIFFLGILLYFIWPSSHLIMLGSALFGLARGGGEIFFNLFVTRISEPEHIANYMSVHTFLAGLRILAAPFLGFYLVQWMDISAMVVVTSLLVFASILAVVSAFRERARMVEG